MLKKEKKRKCKSSLSPTPTPEPSEPWAAEGSTGTVESPQPAVRQQQGQKEWEDPQGGPCSTSDRSTAASRATQHPAWVKDLLLHMLLYTVCEMGYATPMTSSALIYTHWGVLSQNGIYKQYITLYYHLYFYRWEKRFYRFICQISQSHWHSNETNRRKSLPSKADILEETKRDNKQD